MTDPAKLANAPIATTLTVQYTYNDYLGTSRTVSTAALSFDILIVSPCQTTTFTSVSFTDSSNAAFTFGASSAATTNYVDGEIYTYKFGNPDAQADLDAGISICGTKSYSFATCTTSACTTATTLTWITVATDSTDATKQKITVSPLHDHTSNNPAAANFNTALEVYLLIKLTDSRYAAALGVKGPYYIKVTPATCACKYIDWSSTTPAVQSIVVNYNEDLAS